MKALKNMNTKMQKEITNFINLKVRIAFYKSGLHKNVDDNVLQSANVFFEEIEDHLLYKLDDFEEFGQLNKKESIISGAITPKKFTPKTN